MSTTTDPDAYHPDEMEDPADVHDDRHHLRAVNVRLIARLGVVRSYLTARIQEVASLRAQLAAVPPLSLPLTPSETHALAVDTLCPVPPVQITSLRIIP